MARVKKKAHEKLSKANIQHVIGLLDPSNKSKKISKKDACHILNIAYNTTRLQKIIDEHLEAEAFITKRKAQNRGKRATDGEILEVISEYLQGEPISQIATGLYRSAGFVRGIIDRLGVPFRPTNAEERSQVALLPDACVREEFRTGAMVWSAKYHAPAVVKQCIPGYEDKYGCEAYQIYVIEKIDSDGSFFEYVQSGGFNAYALVYDLGSLEHLTQYGVNLDKI